MSKKLFHIATFGCRTNQADTAALRDEFFQSSFEETDDSSRADVVVVNSCTVTHRSDQQVRQLVRRFRRRNPEAKLVVTGCYAQRSPRELASIPGVTAVVGNSHKGRLVQLTELVSVNPAGFTELAPVYRDSFDGSRALEPSPARRTGGRTRPFVKIQDGCDARCTYCIIPSVRGPGRSLPPDEVLGQVGRLVGLGFREIVLTGIHLGTYGRHLDPPFRLHRLLEELLQIEHLERLRLSSIEPMELSRKVVRIIQKSRGVIAPHFHICLQSGCNRTLKRMLRPYTVDRFAGLVEEIRSRIPEAGIGTDVIAGFPGEKEKEYRESRRFVERMPFSYLHVFPYSDRSGTVASQMGDKVATTTIRRRCRELRQISDSKNSQFRRGFIGERLSALTLDQMEAGRRSVITGNYLKGLANPSLEPNRIVTLKVVGEDDAGRLLLGDYPCSPSTYQNPSAGEG